MRSRPYLTWTHLFAYTLFLSLLNAQSPTLSGELRTWHRISLTFDGPSSSETATDNPFADYALEVTFTNGGETYVVPGFYAADGNAAETSATAGNKWRVHFAPDATGQWSWSASFKKGNDVAIEGGGASAGFFDGASGSFTVAASNKTGRDHRGKGRLEYVGEHYLRYAGSKEWFVKAGADAPENTLAYEDFDDVPNLKGFRKDWAPHARDYDAGEAGPYTWQGGRGSELLGAVAYLSEKGVNAFSFLTFNVQGDDGNVFPHLLRTGPSNYGGSNAWSNDVYHDRFDVSRMAQWERIFSYADLKGMYLHFKTQETENDQLMDGGNVGRERKLYYRELIARFGHHLALNWNMGEENTQTDAQRRAMAAYFAQTDPYNHLRVIHTYPNQQDAVYNKLLGNQSAYTGVSIQTSNNNSSQNFDSAEKWVARSAATGKKWVVAVDEPGNASIGTDVDPNDRKLIRSNVVWATFMAGGAGTEFYYGYQSGCGDLRCQDHRTRDQKYTDAALALDFFQEHFQQYLPTVENDNGLTTDNQDYVLANPGTAYAIYRPSGGTTDINLPAGNWRVRWYNPRTGSLSEASDISGSKLTAPNNDDWAALVTKGGGTPPPPPPPPPPGDDKTVFLEAECADFGSAWNVLSRSGASGGTALVAGNDEAFFDSPPTSDENIVRFTFTAPVEGTYRMYARVSTPNSDGNSVWFRVAGSKWYRWNNIDHPDGSDGFFWARAGESVNIQSVTPLAFNLSAGPQTLEIATREPTLQLDKIAIQTGNAAPNGQGGAAINCADEPAGTTYFELECANYGAAWTVAPRPNAAGGLSLRATDGTRFLNSPPTDNRYLIRIPFTAAEAGTYRIFVRTRTTGGGDDSMWIRIGGGKWYKWNLINAPYDDTSGPSWSQAGEWTGGSKVVPLAFDLSAGPQTIEIAQRESGIEIDKLAIGPLIEEPTGEGGQAANCIDEPDDPTGITYYELECANYGTGWSAIPRPEASGGLSLLAPGGERFTNSPPTDDRYLIEIPFVAAEAGTYRIFLRTLTTGGGDDSMWIRVGGGKWYQWNRINFPYDAAPNPAWSQAGEWTRGTRAIPVEFELDAGPQTIEIARRESGIEIDKLAIGRLIDEPSGEGGQAINCPGGSSLKNTAPLAKSKAIGPTEVSVFPNPVSERFHLRFSGRLTVVTVVDGAGRVARQLRTEAEDAYDFSRDGLPAGMYTLATEIDGEMRYARVVLR